MRYTLDISLVIPVKNEAESVPALAAEIERVMGQIGLEWECLWVDDGSTDSTLTRLEELHNHESRYHFLSLARNCGQSAALLAGFEVAHGRLIATLDGDGQNDPADLARMIPLLRRGEVDMVCGARTPRRDTFIRRSVSACGNVVRNVIIGERVSDAGCSLRVFYRECAVALPRFRGLHYSLANVVSAQGFRWIEVPVTHRPRTLGRTKYGLRKRFWSTLADALGVRWLKSRAAIPIVNRSSLPGESP